MGSISLTSTTLTSTTLTLCSWNVQKLSETSNPQKFQAVANTIRSLNCDIIALQEVSTETAGGLLANQLSTTTDEWSADSYVVNTTGVVKEYSVFLWKNTSISDVLSRGYKHDPFNRELHHLDFKHNAKSMTAINFHFRARKSKITDSVSQKVINDREQDALYGLFQNWSDQYLFAVGDFNCYPMSFSPQGQMMTNYSQLLYPRMYTNTIQDDCYDNVLVSTDVRASHSPVPSVNNPAYYYDAQNTRKEISDHRSIKVTFHKM